jgi:uncharacterized membrane protein YgcG
MGCTQGQLVHHCENPADNYNSRGVLEIIHWGGRIDGNFVGKTRPGKMWTARAEAAQTESCPYTFPVLSQKITKLEVSFKLRAIGFMAGVVPAVYLEKLNSSGVPTMIELLQAATPVLQMYILTLDSSALVQSTEKGDILRLKCVVPPGPPNASVGISDTTVLIKSVADGIPPVRLAFEESFEPNGSGQSLEMRSYRSWTIRPGTRGWTNTAPLAMKPTSIIVDMQVECCPSLAPPAGPPGVIPTQRRGRQGVQLVAKAVKSDSNVVFLHLVRQGIVSVACVPIYDSGANPMLGTKTNVHFELDLKKGGAMIDPNTKKLISNFATGDRYLLVTHQPNSQTTMKLGRFMMRVSCENTKGRNLVNTLTHRSKLMTATGIQSTVHDHQQDKGFGGGEVRTVGPTGYYENDPYYQNQNRINDDDWNNAQGGDYGGGDGGGDGGGGGDWGGGGDGGGGGGEFNFLGG